MTMRIGQWNVMVLAGLFLPGCATPPAPEAPAKARAPEAKAAPAGGAAWAPSQVSASKLGQLENEPPAPPPVPPAEIGEPVKAAAVAPDLPSEPPAAPAPPPEPATPTPQAVEVPPPPPLPVPEKPAVARGEPPFVLELRPTSGGPKVEAPIDPVDPAIESELHGASSAGGVQFSILRFSPSLIIKEQIVAAKGDGGPPALRLAIEHDGEKSESWLLAGSRLLGRSEERSALVEYLPSASPEEFRAREAFQRQLLNPSPKVLIELKRDGRRLTVPGEAGKETHVDDPPYRVEVLKVFNCFAIDPKTREAIDQNPRPLNPAAQVRITRGGDSRTTWLFSQLPQFSQGADDEDAALRFVWPIEGHPHEGRYFSRAEILVFDSGSGLLKALVGVGGQVVIAELPVGRSVAVLGFTITAAERIASARITQTVSPAPGGSAAVLLGWVAGAEKEERWIPAGATEEIRAGPAILSARLLAKVKGPHGMGALPAAAPAAGASGPLPAGHPPVPSPNLPAGHPRVPGPGELPAGHPRVPDPPGEKPAPPPVK
jgi:hypothetical protein